MPLFIRSRRRPGPDSPDSAPSPSAAPSAGTYIPRRGEPRTRTCVGFTTHIFTLATRAAAENGVALSAWLSTLVVKELGLSSTAHVSTPSSPPPPLTHTLQKNEQEQDSTSPSPSSGKRPVGRPKRAALDAFLSRYPKFSGMITREGEETPQRVSVPWTVAEKFSRTRIEEEEVLEQIREKYRGTSLSAEPFVHGHLVKASGLDTDEVLNAEQLLNHGDYDRWYEYLKAKYGKYGPDWMPNENRPDGYTCGVEG